MTQAYCPHPYVVLLIAGLLASLAPDFVAAYGWPSDLSDDEILERLLELNLERA